MSGVSTRVQSYGLVAHENSTFRNLALAVSVPFMMSMGTLVYFNVHMIKHWSMFVMLMNKNACLCGLYCHGLPSKVPR